MPSVEVPRGTADRALVPAAAEARPAWDLEAEVEVSVVEAADAVAGAVGGRQAAALRNNDITRSTE
jgi:hypothetical protein